MQVPYLQIRSTLQVQSLQIRSTLQVPRGKENICCIVSKFVGPKVSYGVREIIVLATLVFWARRSQNFYLK